MLHHFGHNYVFFTHRKVFAAGMRTQSREMQTIPTAFGFIRARTRLPFPKNRCRNLFFLQACTIFVPINYVMKRICAVTMVRNDEFYLRKWVEYYGAQLGRENLRIYFDGEDQRVPDFCEGVPTELKPRIPGMVVKAEKERLTFLSLQAARLMQEEGYDVVIGVDADEFLIVDPKVGMTLQEYLSGKEIDVCMSGLGVDVGQHLECEEVIDASKPFLNQRGYAYLCSRYTKPSVIAQPVMWGSGFHRVKGHNYHIDENLFLFHFGSIDLEMIKERMGNNDLVSTGRLGHIKKRAKTIYVVSAATPREWDKTVRGMRFVQQWIRQPFAWNKPWNPITKVVVRIPERFKDIL